MVPHPRLLHLKRRIIVQPRLVQPHDIRDPKVLEVRHMLRGWPVNVGFAAGPVPWACEGDESGGDAANIALLRLVEPLELGHAEGGHAEPAQRRGALQTLEALEDGKVICGCIPCGVTKRKHGEVTDAIEARHRFLRIEAVIQHEVAAEQKNGVCYAAALKRCVEDDASLLQQGMLNLFAHRLAKAEYPRYIHGSKVSAEGGVRLRDVVGEEEYPWHAIYELLGCLV
mmetsp:Transcript_4315/g.8468  ORF Transcript_4315/g.8468 Transcript_4315/m.8468 type:complete len:227 (-) Transcript_4315:195-875(-)